jgi:hypothetical protein
MTVHAFEMKYLMNRNYSKRQTYIEMCIINLQFILHSDNLILNENKLIKFSIQITNISNEWTSIYIYIYIFNYILAKKMLSKSAEDLEFTSREPHPTFAERISTIKKHCFRI